jgi:hypothetical protein
LYNVVVVVGGLNTCVGPLVSLEMRALGVDLLASGKLALVDAATLGDSAP